ncbi:hypothetical protein D3C72_1398430 [compost metagenome]
MHAGFIDEAFMAPRQRRTAPCLAQLDMAHGAAAEQLLAQFDHAVDHGVLRAAFFQPGAGQQQHGATGKGRMAL